MLRLSAQRLARLIPGKQKQRQHMIKSQDLLDKVRATPFAPFRVTMTNGDAFNVMHPDQVLVLRHKFVVGVGGRGGGAYERDVDCSLLHVVSIEDLPAKSARKN
jgi:hypothetical protein